MENRTHVPSKKQNLRTHTLLSHECLICRKLIILECSLMTRSWPGVGSYQPWEVLLTVSRDTNKKWPRSGWSRKISWIELCWYDWTSFVSSRDFQSWFLFVLGLNRLALKCPLFTFLPINTAYPEPSADMPAAYYSLYTQHCCSQINSCFRQLWACLSLSLYLRGHWSVGFLCNSNSDSQKVIKPGWTSSPLLFYLQLFWKFSRFFNLL